MACWTAARCRARPHPRRPPRPGCRRRSCRYSTSRNVASSGRRPESSSAARALPSSRLAATSSDPRSCRPRPAAARRRRGRRATDRRPPRTTRRSARCAFAARSRIACPGESVPNSAREMRSASSLLSPSGRTADAQVGRGRSPASAPPDRRRRSTACRCRSRRSRAIAATRARQRDAAAATPRAGGRRGVVCCGSRVVLDGSWVSRTLSGDGRVRRALAEQRAERLGERLRRRALRVGGLQASSSSRSSSRSRRPSITQSACAA